MRVVRAASMGMCFGVRDALKVVRQQEDPNSVTVLGELVHNERVLEELDRRGFSRVREADRSDIPVTPKVLVTAHGVSDRQRAHLQNAGKTLIDTTCPLVADVHRVVRELQGQGYYVVVIGRHDHVEVQGIVGDLERYSVVEIPDDVEEFPAARLGVVCQTTARPEVVTRMVEEIRRKNPDREVRFVDTVCRPTRERQEALRALLEEVEALVVVGGKNSNNTKQLLNLSRSKGIPAFHVQSAEDVDPRCFEAFDVVGLTAGTSTLESTVDEVHRLLVSIKEAAPAVPCKSGRT